jgi:hypothetical protein
VGGSGRARRGLVSGRATLLLSSAVPDRPFTDAEIDAAVEALSDPQRFREAESQLARIAPQLQGILNHALHEGGWFGEAHDGQVLKAATTPDADDRITAVRTLVAEQTRIGMMVGAAVGWGLADELRSSGGEPPDNPPVSETEES